MHNLSRRARILTAATAVAATAAIGMVYAAWTTNGSGSGYAKAGSSQELSTATATVSTGLLYPGANGDVVVHIKNPNPYPVKVTAISLNGENSDITAAGGVGTCTTTGVSFASQSDLSVNVPAKSGGTDGEATTTLTDAASMSNASANGCQGATFTIPVSLSGQSDA